MKKTIYLVVLCSLFVSSSSNAEPFIMAGPKPLGVAGAYTAVAEGPMGANYNPAGLHFQEGVNLELIPIGYRTTFTGDILKYTNSLVEYAQQYTKMNETLKGQRSFNVADVAAYVTAMKSIKGMSAPGNGMIVNANVGLNTGVYLGERMGKCTLTFNNYTTIGVRPNPYGGFWLGASSGTQVQNFVAQDNSGVFIDTMTVDVVTATPESEKLVNEIGWIRDTLESQGVAIPENMDGDMPGEDQALANALVNSAIQQGVAPEELNSSIDAIKENKTLITDFVGLTGEAFNAEPSNLIIRALNLSELALSGSWPMPFDDLYLGASLKAYYGVASYYVYTIKDEEIDSKAIMDNISKYTKNTIQPGLDLGLMYDKKEAFNMRFGLVAKNINSPKFALPDSALERGETEITLSPQIRAGVAYFPLTFLTLSADADITKNSTLIPNYYTQMASLGLQVNVVNSKAFNLPLRCGISKNLAREEGLIYTGGLGLDLLWFSINFSGLASTGTTQKTATSDKMPTDVSFQASIGLNF